MSRILIQNGRVIDPSQGLDRVTNLLIDDGRIAAYDARRRQERSSTPRARSSRRA